VPAVSIYLLVRGNERAAVRVVAGLTYCFVVCELFYIWLPATSPLYLYESLPPPLSEGLFYRLTHEVASVGGVLGGAFPSSHAALSTLGLLLARRLARGLFWVLLLPTLGLLLATVYGRYHFAADTLAGIALAVLIDQLLGRRAIRCGVSS
jgi:membrane-associated phospholipid phosphatase